MKNSDPLPIPKWLEKGKTLKMPNGNVVSFAGVNDHLIIVTKEGEKIHGTFVIRDDEYEFHTKETTKGKKDYYRTFFKFHKDFIIDIINVNMKNNKELIDQIPIKSWITSKNFAIDIHNPQYPEIPRTDFFWNVEPDLLPKISMSKQKILRCMFEIAVAHEPDGKCIGLIMPKQKHGVFIVVSKDFLELVLDACIGIAWFKGMLHAYTNK